jgi:hypothetical protein
VLEAWVEKSTHANEMRKVNGVDVGGYEYLWWVEYGGVHFPEVLIPGMFFCARGGRTLSSYYSQPDLVIVHRVDNEPPAKDSKTVAEMTDRDFVTKAQFGHLVKVILDAQTAH